MRYCLPLKKKRSVPTNCHWYSGNFVGIKGSNLWVKLFEHSSHLLTLSAIFFDKPGHHTASLALNWHLSMPWWPWYIFSSTWFCIPVGTTIRLLYSNSVFPTVNLAWCSQYYYLGHPDSQYIVEHLSVSFSTHPIYPLLQLAMTAPIISSVCMYSCPLVVFSGALDRVSGIYKVFCVQLNTGILLIAIGTSKFLELTCELLDPNNRIRGLWSVCMRNGCPRT